MIVESNINPLRIAVVRFPGSNCDFDTLKFFRRFGHQADFLWHKRSDIPDVDLIVIPGGFAFGDRDYEKATDNSFTIDPGVQALRSPVARTILNWGDQGKPLLGICNGFQILVHACLLPGLLEQNDSESFFCDDIDCRVEGVGFFNDQSMINSLHTLPVAHGYGRYNSPHDLGDRVFLRYHGVNPNGSDDNIAGVCNQDRNVFGMMPHPERADLLTQREFMRAIENHVRR